jgi:AcrR family transcriptional regulator
LPKKWCKWSSYFGNTKPVAMAITLKMNLNDKLYLRDPQETKLGRKIIQYSILLIDEIGFEDFNFKKLAERIGSTEASIYRYFENKHRLLLFLLSWYWEWVKYRLEMATMNIEDPIRKLKIAISMIVDATVNSNSSIEYVNEVVLNRIVVSESTKGYHTKMVDVENKNGFFLTYKALNQALVKIIKEINPDFPYPNALCSTLMEMAKSQVYFAQHLPSLTDIKLKDGNFEAAEILLENFALGLLKSTHFEVKS